MRGKLLVEYFGLPAGTIVVDAQKRMDGQPNMGWAKRMTGKDHMMVAVEDKPLEGITIPVEDVQILET